ncbi:hypothetical protein V6N11_064356 [Hibiscus sabdariffa]|uniref:Uncharacterized protein n=1 Tax=Hibiscus sabdariffa TaxID=183260 RepID=A0ABR2PNQ1_9ROSI
MMVMYPKHVIYDGDNGCLTHLEVDRLAKDGALVCWNQGRSYRRLLRILGAPSDFNNCFRKLLGGDIGRVRLDV